MCVCVPHANNLVIKLSLSKNCYMTFTVQRYFVKIETGKSAFCSCHASPERNCTDAWVFFWTERSKVIYLHKRS